MKEVVLCLFVCHSNENISIFPNWIYIFFVDFLNILDLEYLISLKVDLDRIWNFKHEHLYNLPEMWKLLKPGVKQTEWAVLSSECGFQTEGLL